MANPQYRHRFYSRLFLLSVGVMVSIALPDSIRRFSVVLSEALILLLTLGLGQPLRTHQRKRLWFDNVYLMVGIASFLSQINWFFAPAYWRFASGLPALLLSALFVFWSLKRLLSCLSRENVVSTQVISGAVAGYLLLGISGGLFLGILESIVPGSFLNADRDAQNLVLGTFSSNPSSEIAALMDFGRIYYFAFVSLTTVGYGDIVPATPPAEMASVALSISGPLYLALVMGLLISRYTIQSENQQARKHNQDDEIVSR